MNRDEQQDRLDRQIDRLTSSLREEGTAPERDLWPGIDEAISRTEQNSIHRRRSTGIGTWRIAALAATVALAIGLGYVGTTGDKSPEAYRAGTDSEMDLAYNVAAPADPAAPSVLQRLDRNLNDLNEALNMDPENRNLSRLVLLVHKSRATVMKQNSLDWAR